MFGWTNREDNCIYTMYADVCMHFNYGGCSKKSVKNKLELIQLQIIADIIICHSICSDPC